MIREALSSTFFISGTAVPFTSIHKEFAATTYGKTLQERVRFERYKPQGVPNAEWVRLLGADVNNLTHMPLTYGLTRGFLCHCEETLPDGFENRNSNAYMFSYDEKEDILLASVIHDWGEAIVKDKMFDLKTQQDESAEDVAMKRIVAEIAGQRKGFQYKIEKVMCETMGDRTSHTGQAFNAIERIGYMRTGLRAYEQSREVTDEQLRAGLEWCANNVLFNQIPALIEYSQIYPPVFTYMHANADRITSAITQIPETVLNNYQGEEAVRNRAKFERAAEAWQNYL